MVLRIRALYGKSNQKIFIFFIVFGSVSTLRSYHYEDHDLRFQLVLAGGVTTQCLTNKGIKCAFL